MTSGVQFVQTGRVWKFGDDINTDLISPSASFRMPLEEQHTLVFSALRPGWIKQVREGDIIVAGANFGVGSGRPIGRYLRACGITGVVASSLNGLGLRNCINFELPAIPCPGVDAIFEEGDTARIDFASGTIENLTRNKSLQGQPLPELFKEILLGGGIVPMLIKADLIEPQPTNAPQQ